MRFLLFSLVLIPFCADALLDSISVTGNPGLMTINTATAGSQPTSVTDSTTSYSITTISVGSSITGQINTAMPTGNSLAIALQAPTGGTSQGSLTMTTTATTLVSGIPIIALASGLTITYKLSATVAATPVTNATVVVTYTLL